MAALSSIPAILAPDGRHPIPARAGGHRGKYPDRAGRRAAVAPWPSASASFAAANQATSARFLRPASSDCRFWWSSSCLRRRYSSTSRRTRAGRWCLVMMIGVLPDSSMYWPARSRNSVAVMVRSITPFPDNRCFAHSRGIGGSVKSASARAPRGFGARNPLLRLIHPAAAHGI